MFIYILIKRVIINNLKKVNDTLGQITGGDLNVTVDVRSNEEFASLSDDINLTVATLKRYIAEAEARIDKELEYAKQIQLSALPTSATIMLLTLHWKTVKWLSGLRSVKTVGLSWYWMAMFIMR